MEEEEMLDVTAITQSVQGPISINSATFVGMRLAGIQGVLLCSIGCIIPSFCICLILAHFYYKYRTVSGVQIVHGIIGTIIYAMMGKI